MKPLHALFLLVSTLAAGGCGPGPDEPDGLAPPAELALAAGPGARLPRLAATADGGLWLSWVSPLADGGHALRYASLAGDRWSDPGEVVRGRDWFVNWADFPSVLPLAGGGGAAHWLVRSGAAPYAYDVYVAASGDGRHWSSPVRLHEDASPTEHGFATLFRDGSGAGVVWLDGRRMGTGGGHGTGHDTHGGAMTLRAGRIETDGRVFDETELDERTCDCCQTGAAMTEAGPIVVYRDRSEDEVRDIYAVARRDGRWSAPRPVAGDGWQIDACPVNGPAVAARGDLVVVAWFTAAGDATRIRAAFSRDAGDRFGPAIDVAAGSVSGRVGVVLVEDGDAVVSWVATSDAGAEIRYRRIARDGDGGDVATLAGIAASRSAGFPQMALGGEGLVFAWTLPGESGGIRTATVTLPR